jgi:hypothetical protein
VRPSSREVIERKRIELSGMRWIWNRISSERPFHSILEIKGTAIDGHLGYVRHWQEVGQAMFYLVHIITYVNGKHLLGSPIERHRSSTIEWLAGSPVVCIYLRYLPEAKSYSGARLGLAVSGFQKVKNYSAAYDRFVGTVNQGNGHLLKPVGTGLKRGNRLYDVRRLDKQSTLYSVTGNRDVGYHYGIRDLCCLVAVEYVATAILEGPECPSCERQNDTTQIKFVRMTVHKIGNHHFTCFFSACQYDVQCLALLLRVKPAHPGFFDNSAVIDKEHRRSSHDSDLIE